MRWILILVALVACEPTAPDPTGCPTGYSEIGQRLRAACLQGFYEEQARQRGGTVTRCFQNGGTMTCVSE